MSHDDSDRPNNRRDDDTFASRWPSAAEAGANGHGTMGASPYSTDAEEEDELSEPGRASAAGRWVSRGGVLVWEEPEGAEEGAPTTTASEAESQWAADELELPPGAPAGARIRAVRAWLLARRAAENEALGMLLLEQRRMQPAEEESRFARRGAREESPLELAMAEHQAAADEYERLYETLADLETHNGPQRLLVEFYLAVGDRLAELANAPEAPPDFAPGLRVAAPTSPSPKQPPSPRALSEWRGRASAVMQARRRIERMTTPEIEE